MRTAAAMRGSRSPASVERRASTLTAAWLAGIFLLSFVYFLPRWFDWNQDARLDMTIAIVQDGTISIDPYHANTGDDDFFRGHYYSNKAPGQSLLAVPVYAGFRLSTSTPWGRDVANALESNGAWSIAVREAGARFLLRPELDFALAQYLTTTCTVALPAVALLLLFYWFLGYLSPSIVVRAVVTLALGLATPVFSYAQVLYSHVPCSLLLFVGFVLVYILGEGRGRGPISRWLLGRPVVPAALAGLAVAGSVVFDYPAVVIAALIGIYALLRLPRRLIPFVALGGVLPLGIVMAYDYAAYKNPLVTGYSGHSLLWKQEAQGVAGFTWPPHPDALWGMSFSPYRGIFFLSPFLLLALPAIAMYLRKDRLTACLFAAAPLIYWLTIAMYWGWFGGWAVGPRYLLPAVPFLAAPIAIVLDRLKSVPVRLAVTGLMLYSLVAVWAETIGTQEFPKTHVSAPLWMTSIPAVVHGDVALNLGTFLLYPAVSRPSLVSLGPLVVLLGAWSGLIALNLRTGQKPRHARELLTSAWEHDPG